MGNTNFWNDAAKYGAILGVVLAVSMVLETMMSLSGSMKLYYLMTIEWIAVVALHYYLLHRFTRSRSNLYTAEEGYSFGQGYVYILTISAFAGIITGVVQYIYLHVVIGYSTYTDKMATAITDIFSKSAGSVPASMESMLMQAIAEIQSAPEPSVFGTVWSGVWVSVLFGAVFGLIIAGVISRSPRPFEPEA